jgi:Fe-S cluster biosynthesis and repair protein YggX
MTEKLSPMELEGRMDEYASDPNYRNIPDNMRPPYLVRELRKYQYQDIHKACFAEAAPPITNEKGEVFYSRTGGIFESTGVGKTAIILGVANYDVPEPIFDDTVITTSLNLVSLKTQKLPMIQCTVICTSAKVLDNAWIRDIKLFYPNLPYYRFETIGIFEKEVKNSIEFQNREMQANQTKLYIGQIYNQYVNKQIKQEDFEVALSRFGDITTKEQIEEYNTKIIEDLEEFRNQLIENKLLQILNTHKVFFVTKDSFYFLFKLFDKYRISRFVFDEPQNTTLTKQELFEDMKKDPRIKKLRSAAIGLRTKVFAEASPFGFIWYVTATPQLILDNVDKHYFNGWVAKNDFLINDYSTNTEEMRMFPELVQQYIIKTPYSYCLESVPGFKQLRKDYKLKCKVRAETAILRGVLGDDIDQMLENDDYQGIVDKLGISGGSANSILEAAVQRLQIEIRKHEVKIQLLESQAAIDKSIIELEEKKKNLDQLMKKIARFYGTHLNGAAPEECLFCSEELQIVPTPGMNPDKVCCAHMSCMSVFHIGCIGAYMKTAPVVSCPICRETLKFEDLKPTYDSNGNNLVNQVAIEDQKHMNKHEQYVIDTEKEYDSKMDALKAALGPMERINPNNGQSGWYNRQKVLLFIDLRSEDSTKLNEIIQLCQDSGFNIRLPFKVGTISTLETKYPTRNGCKVKQAGAAADINKDIDSFLDPSTGPWVWISRSIKDSAGLSFVSADTLIKYSPFKSHVQINGRLLRMNRVVPCDIFELSYI